MRGRRAGGLRSDLYVARVYTCNTHRLRSRVVVMRESPPRETDPWAPPLLRWAGSKRQLVPALINYVPSDFDRYVEPFAGSACLFFALNPSTAVLGDQNRELLDTYDVVRRHPRLVARAVHSIPDTPKAYLRVRNRDLSRLVPIDRAARFVYLNRHCFNGVYRTNRQGQFNVPRGRNTGKLPSEAMFYRCSVALRRVELRPVDFEECIADVRRGDFVYLDPPYASSARPRYGEYGYGSFDKQDLGRLLEALHLIDQRGGVFLLSYYRTRRLKIPPHWHRRQIAVRRHVAGFAHHRRIIREILVTNRRLEASQETLPS